MGVGKLIAIFGIILVVFTGIVFYQYNSKSVKSLSPKTPSATVTINKQKFKVAVARTDQEQQKGLSVRESLPQEEGMLFVFEQSDFYIFWMKNMKFPIDIIFIKDDKIVSVVENAQVPEPTNPNPPIIKPEGEINRVLEINSGLSKKYNIKKGDRVEIKL